MQRANPSARFCSFSRDVGDTFLKNVVAIDEMGMRLSRGDSHILFERVPGACEFVDRISPRSDQCSADRTEPLGKAAKRAMSVEN